MYTEFYGFAKLPFSITPDPKFVYYSKSHHEALAQMLYGIQERKCLMVCTGEVGVGKTTMIFTLLSHLGKDTLSSLVFDTHVDPPSLYKYLFADYGIGAVSDSRAENTIVLKKFLTDRLNAGQRSLLVLDEAHNLRPEIFHEVVHLTNFETRSHKLLQILLVGQPELKTVLNSMEFRQLKQRINLRTNIRPLELDDVDNYIRHRLRAAGAQNLDLFAPDALALIHTYSRGLPRMINTLCDNALLLGFTRQQRVIDGALIQETYADLMDLSQADEAAGEEDEEGAGAPESGARGPASGVQLPDPGSRITVPAAALSEPVPAAVAANAPTEQIRIEAVPADAAGTAPGNGPAAPAGRAPAAPAGESRILVDFPEATEPPKNTPFLKLNESSARELMPALVTEDPAAKRQFHLLATRLEAISKASELHTVVVTSAVPQEGKTITAINLAFTMAQESSNRVLLVDADFRQPALHTYFGYRPIAGASEVIQGKIALERAFHRIEYPNLYALFAGKQTADPAALLEASGMPLLLAELRRRFDYILIDSPPVVPIADTCTLAGMVDGVIVVVRARHTDRDVIRQAMEDLSHSRVLGVVFNDQRIRFTKSRYHYGYGYLDQAKGS